MAELERLDNCLDTRGLFSEVLTHLKSQQDRIHALKHANESLQDAPRRWEEINNELIGKMVQIENKCHALFEKGKMSHAMFCHADETVLKGGNLVKPYICTCQADGWNAPLTR